MSLSAGWTSLARDSGARLAADAFALVASLVTATVTARALGPAGKGYYASLTLLATVLVAVCDVGIGDALIVLTGRGRASLTDAVSSTVRALLVLVPAGAVAFLLAGALLFDAGGADDRLTLLLGAALVATGICYSTLVSVPLAMQRVMTASGLSALAAGAAAAAALVLVAALGLGVEGAVLAALVGTAAALAATLAGLRAGRVSLRPRRARGYLGQAVRLGVPFQLSNLLVVAAARLDLLLVFKLSGAAAAGRYSVALTVGALVSAVPTALAYAAFPRLPRLLRTGVGAALAAAAVLAAVTPIVVPALFGQSFAAAVTPALVLLAAGVLYSAQWLLARAWSARGAPQALFVSFAASFVVMVALDFALIPGRGATGAALAALAASAAGAAVVGAYHWRASPAGGGRRPA
jgi:O-antigen/teichoic acid export membrane protein